ncbi:MAG TPA: hypothetical protein VGB76_11240 [Pyrinomonadaceae bacterium]|jgi:hypothetical protein
MKTGDYRRDYAAYAAALERARYDYHTGVTPELRLTPIRDRYADLWTRDAVNDLTRAREEISRQFETERVACAALLRAAQLGYVEAQATDVTRELARCRASAVVEWNGASLAPEDAPDALALEPDAARRRELSARWFEALRACNDLRAARFDTLREAARTLNFNSYFEFLSGIHEESSLERLSAAADNFLARTTSVYNSTLFEWAARHLPPEFSRAPAYADSLFLRRLSHLDPFFPASELRATYEATMQDLGVRAGQQHNLSIEATGHKIGSMLAACYALRPPEEVRLVHRSEGGASLYQMFFAAAGGAQAFAWVSRDLAARYPELVYAPDETTRAGFQLLFADLLADAAWLTAHRNVRPSSAGEIARSFAFVELQLTRRAAVRLQQQRILDQARDPLDAQLAEGYAVALEEAINFRPDPSLYLRDLISDDPEETRASARLQPAVYLRARLFATALGEYFRTRYGHRWWAARRAADELIDLWNTGSRYTVEELASLAGLGDLNFDLLADTTEAALRGE